MSPRSAAAGGPAPSVRASTLTLLAATSLLTACASLATPRAGAASHLGPDPLPFVALTSATTATPSDAAASPDTDAPLAAPDDEADSLSQALLEGTPSLSFRLRLETVDQSGFNKDADAVTLRTRFGYRTMPLDGWQSYLEIEDVTAFGDAYNSTTNGQVTRPVIADPESTELNELWVSKSFGDTSIKAGRQKIVLDNARFIGDVGWRQNNQTFDALTIQHAPSPNLDVMYSFVRNANRIFGENSTRADARQNSHILHADYALDENTDLVGYWYGLDFNGNSGLAGASTSTVGARLTGTLGDDTPIRRYVLEFAHQGDIGSNPKHVDEQYYNATLGTNVGPVRIDVGQEVLGGSKHGTDAFTTPLATLHGQNGWADKFLATPTTGLQDSYFKLGGKVGDAKLAAVYHDFEANATNTQYGWEMDLLATAPIDERSSWGVKWADYHAQAFATNTKKLWFWYEIRY